MYQESPYYGTLSNGKSAYERNFSDLRPLDIERGDLLVASRKDADRFEQSLIITEGIIKELPPEATLELFRATNNSDVDLMFDNIFNEVYDVLFGQETNVSKKIESYNLGYLDKLTQSVEENMRCANFGYFITSVLPNFEMNWHHWQWSEIPLRYRLFAILASRDHGKSFMFSNAYPAWKLYSYKPRTSKEQNENRGFLFSFSITQAVDLLEILKGTIEDNDILKERLYNKERWSKTDITCANRARLTVKGFGSAVRGAHPAWAMIDDGLKDNVLYSSVQNQKMIDYFHAVIMNMIVPGGSVGVVGTPFRNNDLYGDLKLKENWKVFEYPAIFPDGSLLWENRWNYNGLMEKRKSQGNLIFSREILCKPVTSDSTIFPMEILNTAFFRMDQYKLAPNIDSFPIKFRRVVTGCDFAISSSVGADSSVFLTFGIDEMDKMWLINAVMLKGASYGEQIAHLKTINSNFRPDVMMLEANVFQQIFVEESLKSGLPVVPHVTGVKKNDLREGLPSLALMFERSMFKIPTGDQKSKDFADLAVAEFMSIAFTDKGLAGTSEHDDICMAWWISVEAARKVEVSAFNFAFV